MTALEADAPLQGISLHGLSWSHFGISEAPGLSLPSFHFVRSISFMSLVTDDQANQKPKR